MIIFNDENEKFSDYKIYKFSLFGMSNFMERLFEGDSMSSDTMTVLPRSVNKKDGKQRITFQKYQDTYNSEGIEYIFERSTDLRTWTISGVT